MPSRGSGPSKILQGFIGLELAKAEDERLLPVAGVARRGILEDQTHTQPDNTAKIDVVELKLGCLESQDARNDRCQAAESQPQRSACLDWKMYIRKSSLLYPCARWMNTTEEN